MDNVGPHLLSVDSLTVTLQRRRQPPVELISDVSLTVDRGQCLAVVGESGSGKSISAMAVAGLLAGNMTASGSVQVAGQELLTMALSERRKLAGPTIGFIFQDAMTALHPLMSVREQMIRPIRLHLVCSKNEAIERAAAMLEKVGIPPARNALNSYIHQLSGGLRQRVMIAMALSCGPALVIADEPTTALDAVVQGQILELLAELRATEELGMILISHDIAVVARHSDQVAVMYAGQVVENGSTERVLHAASHPYSYALIKASPDRMDSPRRLPTIPGQVPTLDELPSGCRFAPRCSYAVDACTLPQPTRPTSPVQTARCCRPLVTAQ